MRRTVSTAVLVGLATTSAQAGQPDKLAGVFTDIGKGQPGCSVATVRNGAIDFAGGYGVTDIVKGTPITADTVFDAASLSKQFTGFAILLLEKQGVLKRTDSVRKYVPELGVYAQAATVGDLLHHTSGLRDALSIAQISERPGIGGPLAMSADDMVALLARQNAGETPPSTEQMYSNSGYRLLAVIAQRASGRSLQSILSEAVFKPLGMTSTFIEDGKLEHVTLQATSYQVTGKTFQPVPASVQTWIGAGGVRTTANDFARWMENYWTGRAGGKDVMARMGELPTLKNNAPVDYAAGVTVARYRGLTRLEHGGSVEGFRNKMAVYLPQRFAAVVFCNRSDAATTPRIDAVSDVYLDKVARAPKKLTTEIEKATASDNIDIVQAETGFYRDRRYAEYLRLLPGATLSYRGEKRALTQAAPGVYRADELAAFPGFQIYIGFKQGSLGMAYGGEFDHFDHVPDWVPGDLSRYVGSYWSDEAQAHFTISQKDGGLVGTIGKRAVPLAPGRPGEFIYGRGAIAVPAEGPADSVTIEVFGLRGLRFNRK